MTSDHPGDQEKQMQALFAAGDPGARVPERLPQRVAARLAERPAGIRHMGWARTVTVSLVLVSSAGLGAAAVFVAKKQLAPLPAPAVVAPATKAPARAVAAPLPPDPVALEAQLVREALEALQRGDADGARTKLDEREARFPDGVLQAEAEAVRHLCGR